MIVLRIEHRERPTGGGFRYHNTTWCHLPNPAHDRGICRCIDRHEVCAATPEKFGVWWPAEQGLVAQAEAEGYRIIALDVPEEAATIGEHQVVFDRYHPAVQVLHEVRPDPVKGWLQ